MFSGLSLKYCYNTTTFHPCVAACLYPYILTGSNQYILNSFISSINCPFSMTTHRFYSLLIPVNGSVKINGFTLFLTFIFYFHILHAILNSLRPVTILFILSDQRSVIHEQFYSTSVYHQ